MSLEVDPVKYRPGVRPFRKGAGCQPGGARRCEIRV